MKHLFDWYRAHSWDIFAVIGVVSCVRTFVVFVARIMLRRRRSDEYYTRRNREPERFYPPADESCDYPHCNCRGGCHGASVHLHEKGY